ncbi:hypothetical protein FA140_30595, partial [Pseudomonas aeruginosa]|nr:hypothetical protein [Pseudomonas aeruginosa]
MMAEIRRPLSAVERWYWLSDQFSALNVISRVRVHGRLSIDDLRRGLDALQALSLIHISEPTRHAQ